MFDPGGRYLGAVRTAANLSRLVFRGGKVYGVRRDQDGVWYVVRLRIARGAGGSGG